MSGGAPTLTPGRGRRAASRRRSFGGPPRRPGHGRRRDASRHAWRCAGRIRAVRRRATAASGGSRSVPRVQSSASRAAATRAPPRDRSKTGHRRQGPPARRTRARNRPGRHLPRGKVLKRLLPGGRTAGLVQQFQRGQLRGVHGVPVQPGGVLVQLLRLFPEAVNDCLRFRFQIGQLGDRLDPQVERVEETPRGRRIREGSIGGTGSAACSGFTST